MVSRNLEQWCMRLGRNSTFTGEDNSPFGTGDGTCENGGFRIEYSLQSEAFVLLAEGQLTRWRFAKRTGR